MPTYEYRCGACGQEIEVQQKMSDPDLVTCTACGADKLERLISWTSVRSNAYLGAMKAGASASNNESLKGTRPFDTGSRKRFNGNEPEPEPEPPAPSDDGGDKPTT